MEQYPAGLLLPERAPSEGPRSTAAMGPARVSFHGRESGASLNLLKIPYTCFRQWFRFFPLHLVPSSYLCNRIQRPAVGSSD